MVVARTGEKANGRGQLSLFMIDADAPGLSRQPIPTGMNIPEQQWTLYFDDVEISADRLIGEEYRGFKAVFDGLNPERILVGGVCTGIGQHALKLRPRARRTRGAASNMGKLMSAEAGIHCLDRVIQTHSGNGVASEYRLTDCWFLVRMLKIGPVSEE